MVAQHIGDDVVSAALSSTDGLTRGMEAKIQEGPLPFLWDKKF